MKYNDAPIEVDYVQSVKEVRSIYSSLTDKQFITFYAKRYNVSKDFVKRVLCGGRS